ncbi:hypothetical protein M3Y96_01023700 [Aphelenchoides besseyi]|nr:hypothetical protein M3Y96_01023700 [Aphelenchoides besseyi]
MVKISRTAKEVTAFVAFLGGKFASSIHVAYYTIQNNESLVAKNERQELFYIRWLKERIPALKGIGNSDD